MRQLTILFSFLLFTNISLIIASSDIYMNEDTEGYIIIIKSEDINDAFLYISRRVSGNWENIDSAVFEKGKDLIFKGSVACPEMFYLRKEDSDSYITFFVENSEITIFPDFVKPEKSTIIGSSIHDEFALYQSMFIELEQKEDELFEAYKIARKKKDEDKLREVGSALEDLSEKNMQMNQEYVFSHQGSYISPYIIRSEMYYYLELDELKTLVDTLDESIANSPYFVYLEGYIKTLEKVSIGKSFVDFTMPSVEGGLLSLSELTGVYLLIDFWASWCGPCRRENPNVVALYDEFHEKGFDILGVSFDNSEENWRKAIKDDNLKWHHVSDLKGWGCEAGKLYGISSIPQTVLLDPQGIIIAKNLRGEELYSKLKELMD